MACNAKLYVGIKMSGITGESDPVFLFWIVAPHLFVCALVIMNKLILKGSVRLGRCCFIFSIKGSCA
jgi:hypothetical protein